MAEVTRNDAKEAEVKRMRMMVVEPETGEGTVSTSGIEEEIENCFLNQRYFDVWRAIVEYLGPNDVLLLVNAEPSYFDSVLGNQKASYLLPLALSIILKKSTCLTSERILTCRLLTKQLKTIVDDALAELHPRWLQTPFDFDTAAKIRKFLEISGTSANPFVGRVCQVVSVEPACFEGAMDLFRRYGSELRSVTMGPIFGLYPQLSLERILEAFNLLPNVQTLKLGFGLHGMRHGDDNEDPDEMALQPAPPVAATLASLKSLAILVLNGSRNGRVEPYSTFFEAVLLAYGPQLEELTTTSFVIGQVELTDWNSRFVNLRKFRLGRDWDNAPSALQTLARVRWPDLESLTLDVPLSRQVLLVLDNFRTSLKELYWDMLEDEEHDVELLNTDLETTSMRSFPKLKKLTVGSRSPNGRIWDLFSDGFQELEELRFVLTRAQGDEVVPPVPELEERQQFFLLFPKAKQVMWSQRGRGGRLVVYKIIRDM